MMKTALANSLNSFIRTPNAFPKAAFLVIGQEGDVRDIILFGPALLSERKDPCLQKRVWLCREAFQILCLNRLVSFEQTAVSRDGTLATMSTVSASIFQCNGLKRIVDEGNFGRGHARCDLFTHQRQRFSIESHSIFPILSY